MTERQLANLALLGQMSDLAHDVEQLDRHLAATPQWRPAAGLRRQIGAARTIMADLQQRIDQHLVITLIGPSGAGKSTLFNALAGRDDVSPTGHQRPTTRSPVILGNSRDAARPLTDAFPEARLAVQPSNPDKLLAHAVLVDTPDTDSNARSDHIDLLDRVIDRSDVLICVFDGENPRRRDHIDYLAPHVQKFAGASLVAVLNKCDRLAADELTDIILPAFKDQLDRAWEKGADHIYFTSARSHLRQPGWAPQVSPRHDRDQFGALRQLIFNHFNTAASPAQLRLANAGSIRDHLYRQTRRQIEARRSALEAAAAQMTTLRRQAMDRALDALRSDDRNKAVGVQVQFYQKLAQRWIGPMGWVIAVWARLLTFGAGAAALLRFGNPLRQAAGVVSTVRRYKATRKAIGSLENHGDVARARRAYRRQVLEKWPAISRQLIQGGFDASVRRLDDDPDRQADLGQRLARLWTDALDNEISRSARHMSHALLQLLFNLPPLALMAYIGYLTTVRFLSGQYMNGDFFLHALLTLMIVLLLCFFCFQALARLIAGGRRIPKRAFAALQGDDQPATAGDEALERQVELVLALDSTLADPSGDK